MEWAAYLAGAVLILVGLHDVFQTLFHPSGRGRLSIGIIRAAWRLSHRVLGRPGQLTGPVAIVLVITAWVLVQVLGWALLYLPHVPEGFSYSPGVDPSRYEPFAEAVYVSLVTVATLGFGDVVAVTPWLRLLAPLQALTGFALLTAAVSWLMQLYPALARRRGLALQLTTLERARQTGPPLGLEEASTGALLHSISEQLGRVRVDLGQNAETYYFCEKDDSTSLPLRLPFLQRLAAEARRSGSISVAAAGAALEHSVADLAAQVGQQFLREAPKATSEIVSAVIADHSGSSPEAGSPARPVP